MLSRLTPCVSLALLILCATPARGHDSFNSQRQTWDGLSDFVHTALEQGFTLNPRSLLDYSQLQRQRPILIIHPNQPLQAKDLQDFVADGGRVLIYDDFGSTAAFLAQLSEPIHRLNPTPPHAAKFHLNANPNLPLLNTPGTHPLLDDGVRRIAANHPAAFISTLPAVIYYDDPSLGFAYDLSLGKGKLILVGDPSLLINLMLSLEDNRLFAINTLRYLCDNQHPCPIDLYVGDFPQSGTFQDKQRTRQRQRLREAFTNLNQLIAATTHWLPEQRFLRAVLLLLTVGLLLLGFAIFPMVPPRFLTLIIKAPDRFIPRSDFERNMHLFSSTATAPTYALPLAILRDDFENDFLRRLYPGTPIPDTEARYRPAVMAEIAQRYANLVAANDPLAWKHRRAQALRLLRDFARLPNRVHFFAQPRGRWTKNDLLRLHRSCQEMRASLGMKG